MNRFNFIFKLGPLYVALLTVFTLTGCGDATPPKSTLDADPSGRSLTPQQRLEALKSNTMMPPQVKERKMRILQDEINGTDTAGPGKH